MKIEEVDLWKVGDSPKWFNQEIQEARIRRTDRKANGKADGMQLQI